MGVLGVGGLRTSLLLQHRCRSTGPREILILPDAAGDYQGPCPRSQVREEDAQWAPFSECGALEGSDSASRGRGASSSPGGGDIHQALQKSNCKVGVARDSIWMGERKVSSRGHFNMGKADLQRGGSLTQTPRWHKCIPAYLQLPLLLLLLL